MLIDPQFQANVWIKKMHRENDGDSETFVVSKISNSKEEQPTSGKNQQNTFIQFLENTVRFGKTLLLEDMAEDIDPSIEAIVSKQIYMQDGILKINLSNNAVDYHEDFKLFMTTKLSNPHFLPEVTIKVAVINFTVTFDGLDD
jgi:dynein heavy chain